MKVVINGEPETLPDGTTVRELLVARGLGDAAAAVELNRKVVRRADHEATALSDGDVVEIVTLVGGG